MAAHDAGVEVTCPGCGETVLQKAMIPILGDGGQGLRYLCPSCARLLVVQGAPPEAAPGGTEDADVEAGTVG